jgi:hypothetical protein
LSAAIVVAIATISGGCVEAWVRAEAISTPSASSAATSTPDTTSSPTPADGVGAEIVVRKVIDADGDLDTVDDQTAGEGWMFDLAVSDAQIVEAFPSTNPDGFAGWLIRTGPEGTTVTLTEVGQDDFAVVDASCMRLGDDGDTLPVGAFRDGSVTFGIEADGFASYQCDFFNVPAGLAMAGISVWKHIDTDGDPDTPEDDGSIGSWVFQATFEDGVEVLFADPVTSSEEDPAAWRIRHAGDSTRVVLTEVPQDGYRLVKASCVDGDSSDGAEIATTLDGNSLSFDVSGFSPFVGFDHEYLCDFLNVSADAAGLPTLPPTDAASGEQ